MQRLSFNKTFFQLIKLRKIEKKTSRLSVQYSTSVNQECSRPTKLEIELHLFELDKVI